MLSREIDWSLYQPVYQCEIPLRWGDLDAFGHVNNVNYIRYLEECRVRFLSEQGTMSDVLSGPVVVNVWCQFLKEIRYPGSLQLELLVGQIGRSSFETACRIKRTDNADAIFAIGGAKVVWVNRQEGKSMPLPSHLLSKISGPK